VSLPIVLDTDVVSKILKRQLPLPLGAKLTGDLDLRPVRHYLTNRVTAHMLLCMLAAYLTWHLRQTLAPLTFTDENIPQASDPVAPAQRSPDAKSTDTTKKTRDNLPAYDYPGLIAHLSHLTRNTISLAGQHFVSGHVIPPG
jgi:hypothetical protein